MGDFGGHTAADLLGRHGCNEQDVTAKGGAGKDDSQLAEIKRKTRSLAYNLASYTWPGWAEPGIEPGASDLATRLEAAGLNLRMGTISSARETQPAASLELAPDGS